MKISDIIRENSSGGSTSAGSIATVNTPLGGTIGRGQFFGGDPATSIYHTIKKHRKKRKISEDLDFSMSDIEALQPGQTFVEDPGELKNVLFWIKSNCSEFLSIAGGHKLYRGIKSGASDIFFGKPREGRSSVDGAGATRVMQETDKYMKMVGFDAVRSNSIFCNSDSYNAERWGKLYRIFPINGFAYGFSYEYTNSTARIYTLPFRELSNCLHDILLDLNYHENLTEHESNALSNFRYRLLNGETDIMTMVVEFFNIFDKLNLKIRKEFSKDMLFIRQEYAKLADKTPEEIAQLFVEENKLTNTNLIWALENHQDLWIHGAYVAIDNDLFSGDE